jgi:hypothetical protein
VLWGLTVGGVGGGGGVQVAAFAGGDEPVWAVGGEVGVAAVAVVGEDGADAGVGGGRVGSVRAEGVGGVDGAGEWVSPRNVETSP